MASREGLAVMAAAQILRSFKLNVFPLGMLWIKNVNLSYLYASPSIGLTSFGAAVSGLWQVVEKYSERWLGKAKSAEKAQCTSCT
jgi:hypothetical protein